MVVVLLVGWIGGGVVGIQDVFVKVIQFDLVFMGLQLFFFWCRGDCFQLWFDGVVLGIKVGQVWNQIFDYWYVWQWIDFYDIVGDFFYIFGVGKGVGVVDVYGVGVVNIFMVGLVEGQCWVDFVFDVDKFVEYYGVVVVLVNEVGVDLWVVVFIWVLLVDLVFGQVGCVFWFVLYFVFCYC